MNHQQQSKSKTWWAPVWRGLVVDEEGQHFQMRGAIWLFLYLVIHADRKTGRLMRRYKTIAEDMRKPVSTIRKWLSILRQHNYVRVENTGRSLIIHIQKWKALSGASRVIRDGH